MFVHVHSAPAIGGAWHAIAFYDGVEHEGNSHGYVEQTTYDLGQPDLTEAQALESLIDALVQLRERL